MPANASLTLAQAKRKLVETERGDRLGVEINDELIGHVVCVNGFWEPIRLDGARISPARKFTDRKEAAKALGYNHCLLVLCD